MGLIQSKYKLENDNNLLKNKAKELEESDESNNPQSFFNKVYENITGRESPDDDLASLKRTQSSITRQRKLDIETMTVTPMEPKKLKNETKKKNVNKDNTSITDAIAYRASKISMPIWLILTVLISCLVVFLPAIITANNCNYADYDFWQITVYSLSMISSMLCFSGLMASITIMAVRFQRSIAYIWNPQFTNFLRGLVVTTEISTEIIYEQVNQWYKTYDSVLQKARELMKDTQEFLMMFTVLTAALNIFFFIYIYFLHPSVFVYSFMILIVVLDISFILITFLLGKITAAISDQEGDLIRFQLKVRNNVTYNPVRDLEIKNTFDLLLSYIKTLDNGYYVFSFRVESDFYFKVGSLIISLLPGVFPALIPLFIDPTFTQQCFIQK